MIRAALFSAAAFLAVAAALVPAGASAATAPPRIVGSPALTYTVSSNTDWQVAPARGNRIVGAVKTVRLVHG